MLLLGVLQKVKEALVESETDVTGRQVAPANDAEFGPNPADLGCFEGGLGESGTVVCVCVGR